MNTATARQGWVRVRFARSVTPASCNAVLDVERELRMVAASLGGAAVAAPVRVGRGAVVELKPRQFGETARHFLRVATSVDWPADGPDTD